MSVPKPSDLPHQALSSVREISPLKASLREVDECMTDFLGPEWREELTVSLAVQLTDVALANIAEDL